MVHQYGTAILMSDSLFLLLSSSTQQLCRLIDRVAVKGIRGFCSIAFECFALPFAQLHDPDTLSS